LERVSYKRSTLDYIKKQIDNAYDNNGWLIIYSHMSVDPYDENKIKEILSYAKEKLDFVSVREGVERFSE
jgi:hypothetical protein